MGADILSRRWFIEALGGSACRGLTLAQEPGAASGLLTAAEVERFLHSARVIQKRDLKVGVTSSLRATLSDGFITHDAHVQRIDESKPVFRTLQGLELDFRDCWKFNVAAYRLDRLLELNMTPVSVERKLEGRSAAFTWWIEDTMMEAERQRKRLEPPNVESFNRQMCLIRVFDQLICNTDRNQQNILITKDG